MTDWWARKLTGAPSAMPQVTAPPRTYPAQTYASHAPSAPTQAHLEDQSLERSTSKALSKKVAGQCPQCTSGNYMAAPGAQRYRCYDCGYPVVQTTSGMGSTESHGAVIAAPQASTGNNYNPSVIIGRVE